MRLTSRTWLPGRRCARCLLVQWQWAAGGWAGVAERLRCTVTRPPLYPPAHTRCQAFGQRHYWAADVGPATFIGLSTVRFRSNPWSVHEVHVDEEQVSW